MAKLAQLEEARQALHELLTGKRVASIQKDGRAVTFTSATLNELRAYIADLEEQLGLASRRRGPARFGV
ncbi:phage head-tail joining protein [Serratia odorifera]|uniref:phage head-tail joining protein n=1 Tax=Serratia odorifera TaxID=618 RepID=UPI0023615DE5|nr:gpW family head-tail joining protein [Serratia odorifera]